MSRIGKKPIVIPAGVKVACTGALVQVEGPKGKLQHECPSEVTVEISDGEVLVKRSSDNRIERSMHGLTRTLIANMVEGVVQGFTRELEVVGVGFRAEKSGKTLTLTVGLSHLVTFDEPDGITISVDKQIIKVEGIDKHLVGQTAANIRKVRKPDVYKGKGIRYLGEQVRRKAGKAGAKQ
jgi:large subunit ribosomal protein L6